MKNMKSWMLAAILLCGTACVTGNTNADKEAKGTTAVTEPAKGFDVIMDAINQYLVDSIGSQYTAGDMCIPVIMMTCSDGMKGDSVFMWGDYWVFNYKVAGDTLKCVSGGDHAGKMLLKKNENGEFQVVSFEQVEDGHGRQIPRPPDYVTWPLKSTIFWPKLKNWKEWASSMKPSG